MKVLVIGGTQFMGRLTVEALLKSGHEVVLLNRGRTVNPFEGCPNMKHVKCDRMGGRGHFKEEVRSVGKTDAVIDFLGFQESYVQDTIEALRLVPGDSGGAHHFSTKHYIFISTDSVYWAQKVPRADARLSEESVQDFSPAEFEAHLSYCKQTALGEYQLRYGGNKLGCERLLEETWRVEGFPYTSLRLPDAFGPYDNLGGFWELVSAVEMHRPIAVGGLQSRRSRSVPGNEHSTTSSTTGSTAGRFSWAFAWDVRDAILACISKGAELHGVAMHIAHEEAVHLRETATMIAEALQVSPDALCFDDHREAALPSTDFGVLDISRSLRLLCPWRPTPLRTAITHAVKWFLKSKEHRRYHRLVHREPRHYDSSATRRVTTRTCEVKSCWVGTLDKASLVQNGPVVFSDALPHLSGQAVLAFMQRLMDQAGDALVACELHRGREVERQAWALRHFAGHLLPQSRHDAAYRLETGEILPSTDFMAELQSPIGDVREDAVGQGSERILHMGGPGARTMLRCVATLHSESFGFWDCTLLGRRKWRIFHPDTPLSHLGARAHSTESPVDCFECGPDTLAVNLQHSTFSPSTCWECEQTMGEAVIIPNGWWYQTYDDDRTLSIRARYGASVDNHRVFEGKGRPRFDVPLCAGSQEVNDWDLVD
mmetsp:Transcript_76214/g.176831  ORF Transcript_76214/g.176831 Transcript_76214/m.176831 type:complete len:655 (+) Transcript_76214:58-2022(+)|eukprot:CAMPEP_0171064134 /NCGR_PEP_ID=MMETSP0766_2-20121228/6098_1 /TAXON_ID=439317 /ORGANISM="Gambierdiscus australes, Strain CAWD 149" /LENGTH=654 /DNA_ID=CAMNT_0011520135 /DNA_START=57 /DNA_END=2021 /DNA_ORIENTATION=+